MHKLVLRVRSQTYRTAVFLLFLFILAAYGNILHNELFLDDLDMIVSNAYIKDWGYIPNMFKENMIAGAGKTSDYYRPAVQLTFALGYSLWGINPVGYHLLSILFHFLNAALLYILLSFLVQNQMAFFVSLLFALHPVQTEAVASASALGIVMGMFFALITLLIHYLQVNPQPDLVGYHGWQNDKYKRWLLFTGGISMTAVALLCKETMVVIPGLIFLLDFYYITTTESLWVRIKKSLVRSLPYLAVVLVYIALRFTLLNFGGTGNLYREGNLFTESWLIRLYTFFTVLLEFMRILLWPSPLHMEHATIMPIHVSFWNWKVIFGFVLLIGMIAGSILQSIRLLKPATRLKNLEYERNRMNRIIPFCLLWFLFSLVPVSNVFIPISAILVESWLYLPAVGIFLIFSSLLFRLDQVPRNIFLVLIVLACLVSTVRQNTIWKNPISFYEHTLRYAPKSARFQNNLGMAYSDKKRYNDSIERYRLAIKINDQYPETHHNLANSYTAIGKLSEAEKEYQRAIQMNSQFFHSYLSLSSLYFNRNRPDLAEPVLRDLVRNAPSRWEGYYYLGIVQNLRGRRKKAGALWRQGLKVDPHNQKLKQALRSIGKIEN